MIMTVPHARTSLVPCDACGATEYRLSLRGSDLRVGITTEYAVYECTRCGLACIQPQPQPDQLEAHYPNQLWERDIQHQAVLLSKFKPVIQLLDRLHPAHGDLLDVGCGPGDFVLFAERSGWRAHGIEVSASQVEYARSRGSDVTLCPDFVAFAPANLYDAITFNHVLEHVPSPRAYLSHALSLLKPGGLLIISVPNYASFSRRVFGQYWTHLDLPRHLYHFSPAALTFVVESLGCKIRAISFQDHEQNALGLRDSFRRWVIYGLLRRDRSRPLAMIRPVNGQNRLSLKGLAAFIYRGFGGVVARATELLHIADTLTMAVTQVPSTTITR